ncbi:unnamed protein product [marine sediment metagenome]|uniref:Protein phosphatase CheZ n=1 Tax=marine sediment metagenome TaxID=412755 RepID=X1CXL6_9ZZZZ
MAKRGTAGACVENQNELNTHEMTLIDVLSHTENSVNALRSSLDILDSSIYKEYREIALYIAKTKNEVSQIRTNELRSARVPEAGLELEAVVEAAASATNRIMECAETIMTADPSNPATYHTIINDCIMSIFEACSFQDIAGQRISKVVETLNYIDKRVSKFAKAIDNTENQFPDMCIEKQEALRQKRKTD